VTRQMPLNSLDLLTSLLRVFSILKVISNPAVLQDTYCKENATPVLLHSLQLDKSLKPPFQFWPNFRHHAGAAILVTVGYEFLSKSCPNLLYFAVIGPLLLLNSEK
jgi:hypothetical protein